MYVMHANCYVLPGIFSSAWYLCADISAQLYFSSCIWTVFHTSGFKYIGIILTAVLIFYYCQPFKSIALEHQGLFLYQCGDLAAIFLQVSDTTIPSLALDLNPHLCNILLFVFLYLYQSPTSFHSWFVFLLIKISLSFFVFQTWSLCE